MGSVDTHNRLAREIVLMILKQTENGVGALVVAETVVFGVLLAQAGTRELAISWLDALTERVVERLPAEFMPRYDDVREGE